MFRKIKDSINHKVHEVNDNTNVIIWAHNLVEGVQPNENKSLSNQSWTKYECKTNQELQHNFLLAVIKCGIMSENNMGRINKHIYDFTIEGQINGQAVPNRQFQSISALSEFIKSFGIDTHYYAKDSQQTSTPIPAYANDNNLLFTQDATPPAIAPEYLVPPKPNQGN